MYIRLFQLSLHMYTHAIIINCSIAYNLNYLLFTSENIIFVVPLYSIHVSSRLIIMLSVNVI